MTYCPQCGTETEPEAAFCAACGTRLEEEPLPPPRRPPARLALRWSLLGRIVTLAALAVSGVVLYDAAANDGEWRESLFDGEEREAIVVVPSPTTGATVQPSETLEPTPAPEPTAAGVAPSPALPEPSPASPEPSHVTPEEAINAYLGGLGLTYVGDCESASLETDVDSYCSIPWDGESDTRTYLVGLTFSEPEAWLLLDQLGGRDDWLVVDSAPVVEDVPGPPWSVAPGASAIAYNLPAQAITAYLEEYGLEYVGDCDYADLETDIDSYCSILWEDRGDELIYAVGVVFSEPEAWLLLALQGESGGWLVVDAAEFVPGPQDTVPPWP